MPAPKDPLRKGDWFVAPADLRDAQRLVEGHHYSRGGSNTAVYVHGLYHRATGVLAGIAWWLPPTRVACESVNAAEWTRVLSLTRLVILDGCPTNACSFLLSRSVGLIKKDRRFVSLVTYADEGQGHTGAIYRAANWTYAGRTGPYPRWVDQNGRQRACKATKNRTKKEMEDLGYVKLGSYYKHKFVLHLTQRKPGGTISGCAIPSKKSSP